MTATICGAQGWADVERFATSKVEWFRQFVRLEHGVPSHDTFGRVFSVLDTGEFLTAMHAWVDAFTGSLRCQGIAVDGKTLRRWLAASRAALRFRARSHIQPNSASGAGFREGGSPQSRSVSLSFHQKHAGTGRLGALENSTSVHGVRCLKALLGSGRMPSWHLARKK